jgi:hypothetical protein
MSFPKSTSFFILISLIVCTGITAWIAPRGLSFYYFEKAGYQVDGIIQTDDDVLAEIACQRWITNTYDSSGLHQAVGALQNAIRLNSQASQAYLLLGRVNCLLGEPALATQAYRGYTKLRPKNPLGHLELGFALEANCASQNDKFTQVNPITENLCLNEASYSDIAFEWKQAGISDTQFVKEAERAFKRGDFRFTMQKFQRAAYFQEELTFSDRFRWAIASVLEGYPPNSSTQGALSDYVLESENVIQAKDLQWLISDPNWDLVYGDKLSDHPGRDLQTGMMWWQGTAVAGITVLHPGNYQIIIRIRGVPPGPKKIQIEKDLAAIQKFEIPSDDQKWQEFQTQTQLSAGPHLIGVRFIQDKGDLEIAWLRIQTQK